MKSTFCIYRHIILANTIHFKGGALYRETLLVSQYICMYKASRSSHVWFTFQSFQTVCSEESWNKHNLAFKLFLNHGWIHREFYMCFSSSD